MEAGDGGNLAVDNIYDVHETDHITHMITSLDESGAKLKDILISLREVKQNVAKYTNTMYCIITSIFIITAFNMISLTLINKLIVYATLVILHLLGIFVCRKIEKSLSGSETRRLIRDAKEKASYLQRTFYENINYVIQQTRLPLEDFNKVIIKAGCIQEYKQPHIAKLLINRFKNAALFASFMVCFSNLLVLAVVATCESLMLQCPEVFEQLAKAVLPTAACVVTYDIITQLLLVKLRVDI